MIKQVVVLHHEDNDGNCAGWVVKHFFKLTSPDVSVTLHPVQYSRPIPDNIISLLNKETALYIVDFSYSKNELLAMQTMVGEIHVFDHHATAEEQLKDLPFAVFSNKFAGAGLTWDVLFNQRRPATLTDEQCAVPYFVKLVDDYDLWKFELTNTEAFNAQTSLSDTRNPSFWEELLSPATLHEFIAAGVSKLHIEKIEIDTIVKSNKIKIGMYSTPDHVYNIAIYQTTHNLSKVGSALLKNNPVLDFTICWFIVPQENKIVFSLRSTDEKTVDVGKDICLPMGGGGHKNAAGFVMGLSAGLTFIDQLYR